MAVYRNGSPVTTISVTHPERDMLKRLTALCTFLVGKPVTYGETFIEAERVIRIAVNDPEMRERIAPATKPADHVCIYESATEPVPADATCGE